jgi:hypothetical protein
MQLLVCSHDLLLEGSYLLTDFIVASSEIGRYTPVGEHEEMLAGLDYFGNIDVFVGYPWLDTLVEEVFLCN